MKKNDHAEHGTGRAYIMFAINMLLSLVAMYFVMFSMIDGRVDFRNNLNMLYMALTMISPMGIVMLVTMREMYPSKALNAALYGGLILVFVGALAATRTQTAIGDRQFIASMVPHHSGAILMCRQARLQDSELAKLCASISEGQRQEIEQMNQISARLNTKEAAR